MKYKDLFYLKTKDEILSGIKKQIEICDIDEKDEDDNTLLSTAILYRKRDAVEYLLSLGADVNVKSGNYYPIEDAAFISDSELILKLIRCGAKITADNHALSISIAYGADFEAISELANMTDDLNSSFDDTTPLYWSVQNMDEQSLSLLLRKGADPNIVDPSGTTCLTAAIAQQFYSGIKLLISYGADVNLQADALPLHMALRFYTRVIPLLLEAGADINIADSDGRTALFYARLKGDFAMCDYLINMGADTSIKDNYGYSFYSLDDEEVIEKINQEDPTLED